MKLLWERLPLFSNTDGGASAPSPASSAPAPASSAPAEGGAPAQPSTPAEGGGKVVEVDTDESFAIPDDVDQVSILDPDAPQVVATPPVAPAVAPVPVVPPVAVAPAAVAPAAQAAPAPGAPAAPAAQPASEPLGLDNIGDALIANREALIADWSHPTTGRYALTTDEIAKLQTNAEEVIPRLMSRVAADILQAIPYQIKQFVPDLITKTIKNQLAAGEAEQAFFTAFPQIPRDKAAQVEAIVRAVRASNPQLTDRTALMQMVGSIALMQLGLPLTAAAVRPAAPSVPSVPAAPAARVVSPPAFQPAGAANGVNGALPGTQGTDDDPWAGMDLPG